MALPNCVYLRNDAYYLLKQGKWHFLSKTRKDINEQLFLKFNYANGIVPADTENKPPKEVTLESHMARIVIRAKQNAKGRSRVKEFTLTTGQAVAMLIASNYQCSVTGVPLSLDFESHDGRKPYAPSIDRIDNTKGYTEDNCRVVCLAANIAMNTWGEGVLMNMLKHAQMKLVLDTF